MRLEAGEGCCCPSDGRRFWTMNPMLPTGTSPRSRETPMNSKLAGLVALDFRHNSVPEREGLRRCFEIMPSKAYDRQRFFDAIDPGQLVRSPAGSTALEPCQRIGPLSAPENLEFRVGEVLGYLGCDRQNCAVRNCGHALDLAVVVANKAYVFDQRAQAVPSRKRGCLD